MEEFNFCRYLSTKEVSGVDAKRPEETFVLILAQFCGRTGHGRSLEIAVWLPKTHYIITILIKLHL